MSKPVKEMMMADYRQRFSDLTGALVVDIRGIAANENNAMRLALAENQIRVTVIKNTLARKAFAGTGLEPLARVLDGPSALAYGGESVVDVARALVGWARKVEHLSLKAAVLDGELFEGDEGIRRLSQFPTRDEALAIAVQLVLTPARNVVGAAVGPGARLLAIVKQLQEKLEKGDVISKA